MPSPTTPRRLALLVEYDGTEFSGSQSQRGRRTVQDTLEHAIAAYCGEPAEGARTRIALAGRTDAGVHARAQVAVMDCPRADALETVRDALNHYLPEDVAVRAVGEVAEDFDPRRDAIARRYCYRIGDGGPRSPLRRRNVWQRGDSLDVAAMAAAAAALPRGRRDWAAFAGTPSGGGSTVRTLISMAVRRRGAHEIEVSMEADAFLPHQVRRTVGALERVGAGARSAREFAALVAAPASSVGPTAPPQGLTLEAVRYPAGAVDWGLDGELEQEMVA
ncbi:MAG: tRNA pseudouridine synthase A [Chloroflexi bacterium]|nr:tRNA pseudouridine synthase A [Chloroflexota bacterium]